MKFVHLSDLHLGKTVNEFSMIEDQEYILDQILEEIDRIRPEGVIIAGDVYDKPVPSVEAVRLFDDFLYGLADPSRQIFIISGNHDSAQRMAFGARLIGRSGIHLSPVFSGRPDPIRLEDDYGPVNIYLLPFIKPAHVRPFYPEENPETYEEALRLVLSDLALNTEERNVLVAHQFVTGASRSDSEQGAVGGLDNVDGTLFDGFDYVALGHIHRPQSMGRPGLRYCGSPLKYSLSEAGHEKSISLVDLGVKGNLNVETISLKPLRDMRAIKGTYRELMSKSFYDRMNTEDYLHITLTDEDEPFEVISRLRKVYPRVMQVDFCNSRTRNRQEPVLDELTVKQDPLSLFADFYRMQNGRDLSEKQENYLKKQIEEIWEDEE